ncbi:MAG: 4Fe-4S cluster-binding domain-containing protein [Synergistaceae bacterium]|nr:4Fe-4S cluster-binding domain-containing protein [Synergistaceae bacterium]
MNKKIRFSPSLCVTHRCNLNCVYCYQYHDEQRRMNFDTAKKCIDWIFHNIPDYATDGVEIGFIGGEPLMEFNLLRQIFSYVASKYNDIEHIFYATTNGTLLNAEMKEWFSAHKNCFVLGLSLDGAKETHDANRCGSFDSIDFDFFLKNWPGQGVKMTLSEYSLPRLAENIKFVHGLGFKHIIGVNLAEGSFDWSKEEYIKILIPQLQELVEFYVENETLTLNQMLDRKLYVCESTKKERKKWCGTGTGCVFFDTDGKRYPCSFMTPMTFSQDDLQTILSTDFSNDELFIDNKCFEECYLYPLCPICYGANFYNRKTFSVRDKSRCRIQKLIALFAADLHAKRIVKNPALYDKSIIYSMINAIEKIRSLYLQEFQEYLL